MSFPVSVAVDSVPGVKTGTGTDISADTGSGAGIGHGADAGPGDLFGWGRASKFGLSAAQSADSPKAAHGDAPVPDAESFRSRWQAALNAQETGTAAKAQLALGQQRDTDGARRDANSGGQLCSAFESEWDQISRRGIGLDATAGVESNSSAKTTAPTNARLNGSVAQNSARTDTAVAARGDAMPRRAQSVQQGSNSAAPTGSSAAHSVNRGRPEKSSQDSKEQSGMGSSDRVALEAVAIEVTDPAAQIHGKIESQVATQLPQATPAFSSFDHASIATSDADFRQQTSGAPGSEATAGIRKPVNIAGAQGETQGQDLEFSSSAASGPDPTGSSSSPAALGSLTGETRTIPSGTRRTIPSEPAIPDDAKGPLPGVNARPGAAAIDATAIHSSTATANLEGTSSSDAVQPAGEATARPPRRQSAGESQSPAAHAVPAAHGSGADPSAWLRIPLNGQGRFDETAVNAGISASGSPGTAREAFATLDAGSEVGTPAWIHAGSQKAEAGFQDPTLGWVGVRADLSGGGIHATLMPGSAEAAQALSAHLPGLNAYLADEHAPAAAVTVAAPAGGLDSGVGQNMQQGAGQNGEPNTAKDPQSSSYPGPDRIAAVRATTEGAESIRLEPTVRAGDPRGMHISVMA